MERLEAPLRSVAILLGPCARGKPLKGSSRR